MIGDSSRQEECTTHMIYSLGQLTSEVTLILGSNHAGNFSKHELSMLAHAYCSANEKGRSHILYDRMIQFEKAIRNSSVKTQKQLFYWKVDSYAQSEQPPIQRDSLPTANQLAQDLNKIDPENIWHLIIHGSKYQSFLPRQIMARLATLNTNILLDLGVKLRKCYETHSLKCECSTFPPEILQAILIMPRIQRVFEGFQNSISTRVHHIRVNKRQVLGITDEIGIFEVVVQGSRHRLCAQEAKLTA